MMRACIDCGAATTKTRCSTCQPKQRQRRKAAGRTGERGSTTASRKRRIAVLRRDQETCQYCGGRGTIADHYMPLALGGTDDEANLVTACFKCNSAKGDQHPQVFERSSWLAERRAYIAAQKSLASEPSPQTTTIPVPL